MSPRDEFVAAFKVAFFRVDQDYQMDKEAGLLTDYDEEECEAFRKLAVAFADAVCAPGSGLTIIDDITKLTHQHESCRTALLRDCGLEADDAG